MNTAALTGRLTLRVGAGLPAIHSTRPALAERVAPGRPADAWPALAGTLFTLCAHAQRATAQAAVAAARGIALPYTAADRQALRLATAREQVLRISHDWPQRWGLPAHDTPLLLRSCPLWREGLSPDDRLAELPAWLAHTWLAEPVADWLGQHMAAPQHWAAHWALARCHASPVARLLAHFHTAGAATLPVTGEVFEPPLQPDDARTLADAMAQRPGFCAQPLWRGRPASTGPWSRAGDPLRAVGTPSTAWGLLLSRVVDVLRLALPGAEAWLAQGALPLATHEGLAWCETARGMLVHWVRLTPDDRHIDACRVLAPTEWNCHPHGALAQALAGLGDGNALRTATLLALAFDPCVDFDIVRPGMPDTGAVSAPETQHA